VPLRERPLQPPIPTNHFVLDSVEQSVVGEPQVVFTRESDTLSDLARAYGLGYDELVAANPDVDPWLPGDNTPVLLPTQFVLPEVPREGLVLNIATKRLFYFPAMPEGEKRVVKTYPIGIGRVGWETPVGMTSVVAKARDPHWYVPASVRREHAEMGNPLPSVVPPGPDNPLGHRVLQLDMPGYLIHGTNQPYGVGMRVSHGCVRLYPENIELLYELVEIGEQVLIVNEPYLLGSRDGQVFFESHQPLEDDEIGPQDRLSMLLGSPVAASLTEREKDHVRTLASIASGLPLRVSAFDSAEVFARARPVYNVVAEDPDAPTLSEVREMIDEAAREAQAEGQTETL
jgi:L,D-transpeptidase ErfK/SrfK